MTYETMVLLIVVVFLICLVVFIEIKNYYEKKNLLDRIMCKDFGEYSNMILNEKMINKKPREKIVRDQGVPL